MTLQSVDEIESVELYDSPSHSPPADIPYDETTNISTDIPPTETLTKNNYVDPNIFTELQIPSQNDWKCKDLCKKCFCCGCFMIFITVSISLLIIAVLPAAADVILLITSFFFLDSEAGVIVLLVTFCFLTIAIIIVVPLCYVAIFCISIMFKCSVLCVTYVDGDFTVDYDSDDDYMV